MSCQAPSDVPAEFAAIRRKVSKSPFFGSKKRYLAARNGEEGRIAWPDYTSDRANSFGLGEHFQGVARMGDRLILSGGIKTGTRKSELIVIEMGTRRRTAPNPWMHPVWAPPGYEYPRGHSYKNPPADDTSIKRIKLENKRWHAGGIQAVDDVVAVPVYGDAPSSSVCFVRIFEDRSHREIHKMLKPGMHAKAVGITRVSPRNRNEDRFLLVVWDDLRLDVHLSNSDRIEDGFGPPRKIHINEIPFPVSKSGLFSWGFRAKNSGQGTYQSVNLVTDCGGEVYLVGTRNTSHASPTIAGQDILDLYRLVWRGNDYDGKPSLEPIDSKQMYCYNQQCNFGAAAGIHVDDDGRLVLYAAAHWLHGEGTRFNFNEYSPYT